MEDLPIELLDRILSSVQGSDALSCRLVSRRWYHVTPLTRRSFDDTAAICEFLEMYRAFPEFRCNRVGFKDVDKDSEAIVRLLRTCAASINDVNVSRGEKLSSINFREFLGTLAVLPNLSVLRIEGSLDTFCAASQLSFRNLTILRLSDGSSKLATALVAAAPKLKVFETVLKLQLSDSIWPFPQRFRAIPSFLVKLEIWTTVDFTGRMTGFLRRLDQWRNVRVTGVDFGPVLGPEVKGLMERVLGHQAANVKCLTLKGWSYHLGHGHVVDLGPAIDLPRLVAMETLIVHGYGAALLVLPIQADRLRALHHVTLRDYVDESGHLLTTVLPSVKVFRLEDPKYTVTFGAARTFTPWATVFPNLEAFAAVGAVPFGFGRDAQGTAADTECWVDWALVEYLLATMRMRTLKSVAYELGDDVIGLTDHQQRRVVGLIFAGFNPLEMVAEGARAAHDVGAFWARMEARRRPSVLDLEGLRAFHLDFPVDDAFASRVLLRMKPLQHLNFSSENLSKDVLERVAAHHNSLRSESSFGFFNSTLF